MVISIKDYNLDLTIRYSIIINNPSNYGESTFFLSLNLLFTVLLLHLLECYTEIIKNLVLIIAILVFLCLPQLNNDIMQVFLFIILTHGFEQLFHGFYRQLTFPRVGVILRLEQLPDLLPMHVEKLMDIIMSLFFNFQWEQLVVLQ